VKRALFLILLFTPLLAEGVRPQRDRIGFSTTPEQLSQVIALSQKRSPTLLAEMERKTAGKTPFVALSPHDDHLLAGEFYLLSASLLRADTVIVFGLLHRSVKESLDNPKNLLVFDDYDAWESAEGEVPVDLPLREYLTKNLDRSRVLISRKAHSEEHSVEASLGFLKRGNPHVKILPILVSAWEWEEGAALAEELGGLLTRWLREKEGVPGRDLAFLLSNDATHYGPDFSHTPFGIGEKAHRKGTDRDRKIAAETLLGTIDQGKVSLFYREVVDAQMTWCGRFVIPFGLLTAQRVASSRKLSLYGIEGGYGDSYSLGVLPFFARGLGITAPFSSSHWVGYWAEIFTLQE